MTVVWWCDEMKLWSAGDETRVCLVSSLWYQLVPEGFGAGLVELGGISFMVLKKSTSWAGTSANTLLANASRGAWGTKEGVQKICKMVRRKTSTLFLNDWLWINITTDLIKWRKHEGEVGSHEDEDS